MRRRILSYLALAQTRLAMWELERSRLLSDDAEFAYRRAMGRLTLAYALAARADMSLP